MSDPPDTQASHVYIVDDDAGLRDALTFLLKSRNLKSRAYASAEAFLGAYSPALRGCVLTDVRMGGISGLELYARLALIGSRLPCIVLTGHGDVPMAVEALKKGVRDFIEKPFDGNLLVDKLLAAMEEDARAEIAGRSRDTIAARIATLSAREQEVMSLIQAGRPNKIIADDLGIALRTVEAHRSKIFEKMGVRSAVELANLLAGHA